MVVLPLVLAQRVLPAWQRSECHLPRAGNTAAADVCGSWLVSLPRPGRVEGPNNSVRRESRRSPVGANPIRPIGRSAGSNQCDEGPDSEFQNSLMRETRQQPTVLESSTSQHSKRQPKLLYSAACTYNCIRGFAFIIISRKDRTMGDKGGKKNKDKDKKQKSAKHEQKVKGAQDKNRPKG